jgi:hypothetical protein
VDIAPACHPALVFLGGLKIPRSQLDRLDISRAVHRFRQLEQCHIGTQNTMHIVLVDDDRAHTRQLLAPIEVHVSSMDPEG